MSEAGGRVMGNRAADASPSEEMLAPRSLGELAAGDASYQAGRNARESTTRGLSEESLRRFTRMLTIREKRYSSWRESK